MSKDNIKLVVSAKDLASGTIQRVKMSTIALGVALGNLASRAIVGVMNGLRGWINEALEAEKANVMLDAALRGIGQYTPQLSKQFRDLASAVQNETGASDEAVKANIAQLTTLGVMPDKMATAVRAVAALEAVGRGGSQAMTAVARAIYGDIEGFARFVPGVRAATTDAEKFDAVNRLLTAGYEQQQATLNTVGGAWAALKGRLGDAREALIGAVFEGGRIGQAFNDAQAAVGRFLESDKFAKLTDKIRDAADYARQIVEAMDTEGGVRAVAGGIGNVILAALKDGADYIAAKITGSITGIFQRRKEIYNSLLSGTEKALGVILSMPTAFGGVPGHVLKELGRKNEPNNEQPTFSRTQAALAALDKNIKKRAKQHEWSYENTDEELCKSEEGAAAQIDMTEFLKKQAAAAKEKAEIERRENEIQLKILAYDEAAADAAEREKQARDKLAKLEAARVAAAGQNINDWIGQRQMMRDQKTKNNEDLEKAKRRADEIEKRKAHGVKISEKNRQWLEDFNANQAARRVGGIAKAADAAEVFRQAQLDFQKNSERTQRDLLTVAKETKEMLAETLSEDGGF